MRRAVAVVVSLAIVSARRVTISIELVMKLMCTPRITGSGFAANVEACVGHAKYQREHHELGNQLGHDGITTALMKNVQ